MRKEIKMITRDKVQAVVLKSDLWRREKSKYEFCLSPEVYEITQERKDQLINIGNSIRDCLAGIGRISAIASDPKIGYGITWQMIRKALNTDIPGIYQEIQNLNPGKVPDICKVDLMLGKDGRFYIAEIDGHNKHGMGYCTLASRMQKVIRPDSETFPGIAKLMSERIKMLGNGKNDVVLLSTERERFYLPEFKILQDELTKYGVNLIVVSEEEFDDKGTITPSGLEGFRIFVDLPFLFEESNLWKRLVTLYKDGKIDFIIPPKPFLGSKSILALLRNDEKNPELEAILQSQINRRSLEQLRSHIPKTFLVRRRYKNEDKNQKFWQQLIGDERFLIKATVSSGMKGVAFVDEKHKFQQTFSNARNSYYHYILQEEVESDPVHFQFFEENGSLLSARWYMRVTAHFALTQPPNQRVAGVTVTARQDKKVHGATDCLQLGTIIV